jgi:hypothetical protein
VLATSFVLALQARSQGEVPVVVVAPAGTIVTLDGKRPRTLPPPPNTSTELSSFYFMSDAGAHEIRFQEPGGIERVQHLAIQQSRLPVMYTLLRDTLRELKARE